MNKFQEALEDIQFILNKDPNSLSGLDNRCKILDRAGEGNSALEACSRAVKLYPNSSAVRNDRGWTFWGLDKIKEAATDFVAALEIDPAQPQASANLFRVLSLLNDPKYSRLLLARLRTRAGNNESLMERIAATLIKEQLDIRLG